MMIKDEIHGTIGFDTLEARVIDCATFQRMRRIKQMSITNLVYPGANHTRFEHSLGTAHLAAVIGRKVGLEEDEVRKVKLYGLLHDIGHTAFSHEGEDVMKKYIGDHEERGRKRITNGEIADIISENFDPKEIADIGNSPMLTVLPDGRRVLIAGTKGGDVFALDPDNKGALLWRVAANAGGGRGGIVWGGAADSENVYYGMGSGGMVALKMATGQRVWWQPINAQGVRVGNNAAATMIPGVVFVAGTDGKLHALASTDGKPLWEYDTNKDFDTVNKVAGAHGGAISSVGPVIVGGMVYIGSGYGVGAGPFGNVLLAFGPE